MTDIKNPEVLNDADLETAQGGAGYVKLGDIEGMSVHSFELVSKATPKARKAASEEVTLGYTEVEWTY